MSTESKSNSRLPVWAFVPVLLLVFLGGIQLVLVQKAVRDPSFSIQDRYYSRAVSWDAHRAQEAENARLGWRLDVAFEPGPKGKLEVVCRPRRPEGAPLTGLRIDVEGFAVARAATILRAGFVEGPPGEYRAHLRPLRGGLWEFSFSASRAADRFTAVQRVDLPGEGAR